VTRLNGRPPMILIKLFFVKSSYLWGKSVAMKSQYNAYERSPNPQFRTPYIDANIHLAPPHLRLMPDNNNDDH